VSSQPLTSDRLDFGDADEAVEYYHSRGWTDGLPIVPPTAERVGRFLERAGRDPSEIIGTEPTRGRVVTAEKLAINAVMAGCLPEHLPVVMAALEAMCEPAFNLHAVTVSTMGAAVLTVVNGPVVKELGLNSGVSVFGPGNRANATIGRAVRLAVTNVTGAVPGELDKAALGHAGKYTWCIAEAEDASPWEPLHVERGFSADRSVVTVFGGLSPIQSSDPAQALVAAGTGHREIVVVLPPEAAGEIVPHASSKAQLKELLFQGSRTAGTPVTESADGITVVVAGGPAGNFSQVIPLWGGGSVSQSVSRGIAI